jgi:maltose alpha-D-glucosyltransferase/alpha-amylase
VEAAGPEVPALETEGPWHSLLTEGDTALAEALPRYLARQRWFGGKARRLKQVRMTDAVPLRGDGAAPATLVLITVEYTEGVAERYALPVGFATDDRARALEERAPHRVIARVRARDRAGTVQGVFYDALEDREVGQALLAAIARRRRLPGAEGTIVGGRTRALGPILAAANGRLEPALAPWEQSNSSVLYGDRLVLKLFRRLGDGVNPELEIGRYLTEHTSFGNAPPVAGQLEYGAGRREPVTVAILQGFVPNECDAWRFTLDEVERYFERVMVHRGTAPPVPVASLLERTRMSPPEAVAELVGGYLETARLIGRRTAGLHLALAAGAGDPAFAPESFSRLYQRALYQSLRNHCTRAFDLLAEHLPRIHPHAAPEAVRVLALRQRALRAFRAIAERKVHTMRIRCHGDYHLGQLLWTGKDFVIIDFEGEPARPVSERRIKRSPLRDVAGMLRSFHYAAATVFATRVVGRMVGAEEGAALAPWARCWQDWASSGFLKAYLDAMAGSGLLPPADDELTLLLDTYLLDKALYELGYELNNRPEWVWIPLRGILELLDTASRA